MRNGWLQRMSMGALALAAGCGLVAAQGSGSGKLVQMRNGRVLKAASVRTEGDTVIATLEGGNLIGFPAKAVLSIEDDRLGTEDEGSLLNVVRSAGGGGAGGFAPPPPVDVPSEEPMELPAEAAPEAPPQPTPGVVVDDQQRQPIAPQNNPPGPGPRNRRVNRLGFKPRPGDN